MQLDELKKGFWGYQKEGVFQYITAREEEFSRRLLEKEAQADQALQMSLIHIWQVRHRHSGRYLRHRPP